MSVRYTKNLGTGWRFALGEQPGAWLKNYDDSAWREVTVPHDWAVEHPFSTEHSSGTGYLPGGTAFYRKSFQLGEELKGRTVTIIFDGVYDHSSVWVNSYYLGGRPYGYSLFSFDITPFVLFGGENVVTVKVDHRDIADSRWYTGSGIYRKVTVDARAPVHIARHTPFIFTEKADEGRALVRAQATICNQSENARRVLITHTLLDSDGTEAASCSREVDVPADGRAEDEQNLDVTNPRLWSPENPELYTCVTTLSCGGTVVDEEKTTVGIRTFHFDADKGFFLNGVNMKFKGVCVHHDAGCLGAAVRPKVWRRRLTILKELGCNAIRMSHNPHMPELYDLCDERGFMVIDEAFDEWEGVKNKWSTGHNVYPPKHYGYYKDFPDWHERDLSAMVLRDRNHPSVILWSIGNEVDYPNDPYCHPLFESMQGNNDSNKPKQEMVFNAGKPNAERLAYLARELVSIVKKHDPTRPVTAALAFPELSNLTGYADALDVAGYNYKEHLYDDDHAKYPARPILGSENGKFVKQWEYVENDDFISGQFLWTGIDFLGETRGWPSHGSKAGLLDLAGFRKPIAWLRAALWCEKPVAKLFTRPEGVFDESRGEPFMLPSWDYAKGTAVQVMCYTNCERAELFINGESHGVRLLADAQERTLRWDVTAASGELRVVATAADGSRVEDVLAPVGKACAIRLEADEKELTADGLDMAHIVATLVDANGMRVTNAENLLHVHVEGGNLLGLENGRQEDTQPYALPYRRAHGGRLLIYVGAPETPGALAIRVTCDTLLGAELTINCIADR